LQIAHSIDYHIFYSVVWLSYILQCSMVWCGAVSGILTLHWALDTYHTAHLFITNWMILFSVAP